MVIVALLLHAAQLAGVVLQPGSILDGDERASGATAGPRSGKTCLDPGMGPCPVGTVANGTCVPAPYHGNDCDTHASGYFSGLASLAACAAKVKPCKMGNYISYGADKSCSWYSQCDFKHLCLDCSKDIGPNCPASKAGQPKCPHYIAFTSEVLKIAPPAPPPPPPPPPHKAHGSGSNVWAKMLPDGAFALGFVSNEDVPTDVTCDAACFGAIFAGGWANTTDAAVAAQAAPSSLSVRDLWLHKDMPPLKPPYTLTAHALPPHGGVEMFRLTPGK